MKVIQSCDSSSVIFPGGAVDTSSQGGRPRVRSSYLGEIWGKAINGGQPHAAGWLL